MPNEIEPGKMYTPRQAATICGLHYHTILSYIKAGRIEVLLLPSGYYRIPSDKLAAFIDSMKVGLTKNSTKKKAGHHSQK